MKKWAIGLLVAFVALVVVAVGVLTFAYYRFYKPLLSANTYVGGAQRLENLIVNKAPFTPPGARDLTEDQVARFVTVEEKVQGRIGARIADFRRQYEALAQATGDPTSRVVRAAMGEI
jgi:hypothetical protein